MIKITNDKIFGINIKKEKMEEIINSNEKLSLFDLITLILHNQTIINDKLNKLL